MPAGLVGSHAPTLEWDVLFVLEKTMVCGGRFGHRALPPRAAAAAHARHARRDYLDDRRFPPAEGAGVLVISAPDERELSALLDRLDLTLFQSGPESESTADDTAEPVALPLAGRKLHVHTDWGRTVTR